MPKKTNKADKEKKAAARKEKKAAVAKAVAEKKNPKEKAKKAPKKPFSFKALWKKISSKRGLTAIIAALAVALVVAIVVLVVMKANEKKPPEGPHIKISEDFYHEPPEGMDLEDAVSLINKETAKEVIALEGGYTGNEPPVPYDKGWYVFDEDGVARRYRDDSGEVHDLPEADWYEDITRGDPLEMAGDVSIHFVVYQDGENVACCYQYYVLTDKADMEVLLSALNRMGYTAEKSSDTVAMVELSAEKISEEISALEEVPADADPVDTPVVTMEVYLKYLADRYGAKVQE